MIKKFLSIGVHCRWKIQMGSTISRLIGVYHLSPLESIGAGDFRGVTISGNIYIISTS